MIGNIGWLMAPYGVTRPQWVTFYAIFCLWVGQGLPHSQCFFITVAVTILSVIAVHCLVLIAAIDLVKQLLTVDVNKRISLDAALTHPWLKVGETGQGLEQDCSNYSALAMELL